MTTYDSQYGNIGAPEPMAPFKHVVITPENVAAEARLARARPLTWMELYRLRRELARLEHELRSIPLDKADALAQLTEMRASLQVLQKKRDALDRDLALTPFDLDLVRQHDELMSEGKPLWLRYEALKKQYQYVIGLEKQAAEMRLQIIENPQVKERAREQKHATSLMEQEARTYENIIIDRFTQLGYRYEYTDKNSTKQIREVRFSHCHITEDAVYFKIAVSKRSAFGGTRSLLPYGVRVADLIKDDTCRELSISCQRQVTSKVSETSGAWIIVHRLDTNDGLINQVRYTTAMESYPRKIRHRLPICVGVGYNLKVVWLNIADYPHMLVAGFTGAGKSNFINVIISTLVTQHSPEELRLILVDLKDGLEFTNYERLPHLHGKVVDNVAALADQLQELEAMMSERNHLMRGKAKTIAHYNMNYPEARLPRIICIIDEVASIQGQGDTTKRIHHSLQQLTAKGRAPGIHIILSTQRPSIDSIPGNIKVNLSARIVGRMPSQVDSQTVLGSGEAKELANVPGRMLLQIGPDPEPVQTPLIEDEDITAAIKRALEWPTPAPLPVPANLHQSSEWTPEKIVELSLNFLGGNISHEPIWKEIKDDGTLSYRQLRDMVQRIWKMDCINVNGKEYRVQSGMGKVKKLVEIVRFDNSTKQPVSIGVESVSD